jgi:parallel beta-helix repeat protein
MRRALCLLGAVALSLMFAPHALAEHTLVVDNDLADCPTADFTSIQAAVTAADPYTRIFICKGTYTEEVVIASPAKNGIQLIGRGGRDNVILDGILGLAAPTGYNGIELLNVTDVIISHFTVTRFHENIYLLAGANGNQIRHMITRGPSAHDGIRLDNAHGNLIEHNIAFANGSPANGCGIDLLVGASGNYVRHNTVFLNARAGIRLQSAGTGNVVSHNDASGNGRNGILNATTNTTQIAYNRTNENTGVGAELGHGIRVTSATGVQVRHNRSDDNTGDGIRADATAAGNLFERNHMHGNAEHDAHDDNRPANTWLRNHCETDFPPGTICGA